MMVTELNREQLEQLKQSYMTQSNDCGISYGELADADNLISDSVIFEYYDGINFGEEDFF